MAYKHGIYTESVATTGRLQTRAAGTIPVYIGTAPYFMAADRSGKVATPILINSYNDFVRAMGYSDKWDTYTLCEAAYAHFKNDIQTIAPFIVINILDIDKHKTESVTEAVTFSNGVGYILNPNNDIIGSTIASVSLGEDFTIEYTSDNKIKITYTGGDTITTASVTYAKVDVSSIESTDFAGGLSAIDTCSIKCGATPNIIVAPQYDKIYAKDMIAKCESLINGKWGCVAYIDIPTSTVKTIAAAKSYKTTNAINSKFARLHFPMTKWGGKVFHLSVLDAVTTQIVDNGTDGVACRSSSNKTIICDVPVIDASTEIIYSEREANELNEVGITTVNYIGGTFRLWGGHMANYNYANIANIEAKDRSDATVRMQIYLDNWLKSEHIDNIDAPLTRRDIDNIVATVNIGLNSFVNSGYLLKGECYFDGGNNATAELADGNLVLDVLHTEVPNGKAITFQMSYDVSGLDALYETEEV